jgi:hypothetical protein
MADNLFTVGSGSAYEARAYSQAILQDSVMGNPIIKALTDDGVINREDKLSQENAGLVQLHHSLRLTGPGIIGDEGDAESAATAINYDYEQIQVNQLIRSVRAKTTGTISQQRTAFSLQDELYPQVTDWYKQRFIASALNQLGGFNATSFTFDGTTYSGTQRLELTGMQIPTSPTSARRVFATGSDDQTVNAATSATLTLQMFDTARRLAMTQTADVKNFRGLTGKPYDYVALVSVTGMNQLFQQAQSSGNLTFAQMILNMYAGGQKDPTSLPSFIYRGIKFLEVPDHYIPKGVHSSTSAVQTNTHRALFCGAGAVNLCLGKGYTDNSGTVPGFKIITEEKKLRQTVISGVYSIMGMKKSTANSQDVSVITLSHYAA